uniref:IkappaB kinase n=1 Tax=Clastoptera arizonana TaxID=38151 RepID=A0A1B6DI45_9HEMI
MNENSRRFGPWKKDRVLGGGGFGIVTLWKNEEENKTIAIKRYKGDADNLMSDHKKERWSQEVDIMQRLSHPNVVKAVPVPDNMAILCSDLPLLCMEFCSAGDLRQVLNLTKNCCGVIESVLRCLVNDITDAVQYLHKERIIHRDLKPENIVLQEGPNNEITYKLIDLGYAKELDESSICSSFVGTLQYIAPELFLNNSYSSAVDYWSLGLVVHEAATGMRPFLPNMTPANWMTHAKKKSHNDICIYESINKEIVYSKQLFVENHISQCLREELEKWLCLALEWDPMKRGRNVNNQVIIFSELNDILKKKIITIFCVTVYERRSYQIDSATAVNTLKLWIERDTKQSINDQILMLPTGKLLKQDGLVIDCWDPNCNNQNMMLYVYSESGLFLPKVQVNNRMPPLVKWLLTSDTNNQIEYFHRKRVSCEAVFFLRQELELYSTFIEAYSVKMLAIIDTSKELEQLEQHVWADMQQITAMHKLSSESLEYETKLFHEMHNVPSIAKVSKVLTEWTDELNKIDEKLSKLQEELIKIKNRVLRACVYGAQLQNYQEDPGQEEINEFRNLLKEGYECHNLLQKHYISSRLTESKNLKPYSDKNIKKVVYKCLKMCDKALLNNNFNIHLTKLSACEREISTLKDTLIQQEKYIAFNKKEVIKFQLLKQKTIWKIVINLAMQGSQPEKSPSPLVLQESRTPPALPSLFNNPFKPSSNISSAIPIQSPNLFISPKQPSPIPLVVKNGFDVSATQQPLTNSLKVQSTFTERRPSLKDVCLESNSVIEENLSLRYVMQDAIVNFTKCNQSILMDSTALDWDYLKKLED